MKLFKISIGNIEKLAVGEDETDVFERRSDYDHTFHYLPVTIEEVTVDGYEINVQRIAGDTLETMSRDQLKQWLKSHNVEFTPQWGEEKLREVALSHA